MKCPRCLIAAKKEMLRLGMETILVDKMLSKACNASPTPPSDSCECGADWLGGICDMSVREIIRRSSSYANSSK